MKTTTTTLVYSTYRILISAAILFATRWSAGDAKLCDGYEAGGHCYKLFRVSTNWRNASQQCLNQRRGHLASIYGSLQQTHIEQYLKAENIDGNDVWTSGKRPDSEIFWGNPESFWRWVGECDTECRKTGCDGGRIDLAFVIDASGSMASGDGWTLTKNFFQSLLATFDVGDDKARVAFIVYSSKEEMEEKKIRKNLLDAGIVNSKPELIRLLQDLQYLDGNTDTADVLKLLRTSVFHIDRGDRRDAPNVAVILTDGKSTDTRLTKQEAILTQDSGIQMFVVGVTQDVAVDEIETMSSEPQIEDETYFLVKSYADLSEAVSNVSRQICNWNKIVNVVNISAVSPQGCYDNRNEDGLTREIPVIVTDPDVCIMACKEQGYRFAGVGYVPSITDPVCRCGNEFGKGGVTDQCTLSCSSTLFSNTNLCGGMNRNFVYKTDGVYGKWAYDEPNNYNDVTKQNDDVQFCAAVDSMDEDVFTFVDEKCTKSYSFLCEIDIGYCDGRFRTERGYQYFTLSTDNRSPSPSICVAMSVARNRRKTWHNARRYCQDHDGDLLRLISYKQNEELTNKIQSNKQIKDDKYFWIGLYKESHFWMDGYLTEFKWMNFASNEPQFELGDCVYIDPRENFRWKAASCLDDKYFVCDLKNETIVSASQSTTSTYNETFISIISDKDNDVTTLPDNENSFITSRGIEPVSTRINDGNWPLTETTTTRQPDPKVTSPTVKQASTITTQNNGKTTTELIGPNNDASKSSSDTKSLAKKYWWLIVLLCLFFLLLLILIIVFCCYKGSYVKVAPKIYDARPIADAPICTVLGDNEPYNFYVDSSSQVDLVVGSTVHGIPKKKCWNKTISSIWGYDEFYDIHGNEMAKNGKINIE